MLRRFVVLLLLAIFMLFAPAFADEAKPAGFQHRGFYLHTGWFFKHPYAVRTWTREDFAGMFNVLRAMGYDAVMIWPMLESIPMPLTDADEAEVRKFRATIDDAHAAGLKCWLTACPNLTTRAEIAAKPWPARNPYPSFRTIRFDRPDEARQYLEHRTALWRILNNADGYVTIDGDPGGYPGADPADFVRVFKNDRQAIDQFGVDPKHQTVIPWLWCGWGSSGVWQGSNEQLEKQLRASYEKLKADLPEPWEMLPGRSMEGHANDRLNISLAAEYGLMDRSTLLCYEAVEF